MSDTPDIPERTSRFLDFLESKEDDGTTLQSAREHLEDTIGDAKAMLAGEMGDLTDAIKEECQKELMEAEKQLAEVLKQMGEVD